MHNKRANALATLASTVNVTDETVDVKVMNRTLRANAVDFILIDSFDKQDWIRFIIQSFNQLSPTVAKRNLKDIFVVNSELCYRGNGGVCVEQ